MRALLAVCAFVMSVQMALAEVTVFAAASLKTALDEIAGDWTETTGIKVRLSYAASPALARQIAEGAPADIFLSASVEWMDDLAGKNLIRPASRRDIAGNRLVLVGAAGSDAVQLDGSLDIAGLLAGGKLSMALVASVPAGQYGKQSLEHLGLWTSVEASVVQSENVRAALQLVAMGEAPFGIVYASDAVAEPRVAVVGTFPKDSHLPIVYPAALTVSASDDAAAFMDHLQSPEAQGILAANGFLPAE